ncbi:MAG: hypothetical protein EAX96_03250 [Candidatus Lokiarchaeota archaeon]|nr:hypothetical protein [Candidatus Lokiarchaeota archaeon]
MMRKKKEQNSLTFQTTGNVPCAERRNQNSRKCNQISFSFLFYEAINLDVIVYTKEHCDRCEELKSFLKRNNIFFIEKDINEPETIKELLASEYVLKNFCDDEKCIVLTPVVNVDGKWMHKEFFDIKGLNEKRSKKIFLS